MVKFKYLFSSRKFWAAVIGLTLLIVKAYRPDFPLQEEQLTGIVAVLVAYILGTSIEDAGIGAAVVTAAKAASVPPASNVQMVINTPPADNSLVDNSLFDNSKVDNSKPVNYGTPAETK